MAKCVRMCTHSSTLFVCLYVQPHNVEIVPQVFINISWLPLFVFITGFESTINDFSDIRGQGAGSCEFSGVSENSVLICCINGHQPGVITEVGFWLSTHTFYCSLL